jgi:hypothetical protein
VTSSRSSNGGGVLSSKSLVRQVVGSASDVHRDRGPADKLLRAVGPIGVAPHDPQACKAVDGRGSVRGRRDVAELAAFGGRAHPGLVVPRRRRLRSPGRRRRSSHRQRNGCGSSGHAPAHIAPSKGRMPQGQRRRQDDGSGHRLADVPRSRDSSPADPGQARTRSDRLRRA